MDWVKRLEQCERDLAESDKWANENWIGLSDEMKTVIVRGQIVTKQYMDECKQVILDRNL